MSVLSLFCLRCAFPEWFNSHRVVPIKVVFSAKPVSGIWATAKLAAYFRPSPFWKSVKPFMLSLMLKQKKVFGSVVGLYAVNVMNDFLFGQHPAKNHLHDMAVLKNIRTCSFWRSIWPQDLNVTIGGDPSSAFEISRVARNRSTALCSASQAHSLTIFRNWLRGVVFNYRGTTLGARDCFMR